MKRYINTAIQSMFHRQTQANILKMKVGKLLSQTIQGKRIMYTDRQPNREIYRQIYVVRLCNNNSHKNIKHQRDYTRTGIREASVRDLETARMKWKQNGHEINMCEATPRRGVRGTGCHGRLRGEGKEKLSIWTEAQGSDQRIGKSEVTPRCICRKVSNKVQESKVIGKCIVRPGCMCRDV